MRPSSISGAPVMSNTLITATPASDNAFAVPPDDTISSPASTRPRAKSTTPALSDTLMSALFIAIAGPYRSPRSDSDPAVGQTDKTLEQKNAHHGQEPMLEGLHENGGQDAHEASGHDEVRLTGRHLISQSFSPGVSRFIILGTHEQVIQFPLLGELQPRALAVCKDRDDVAGDPAVVTGVGKGLHVGARAGDEHHYASRHGPHLKPRTVLLPRVLAPPSGSRSRRRPWADLIPSSRSAR